MTLEYWDTLNSNINLIGENIIFIKDVGDGGHKQNKQTRDRKLLEDEIYKSSEAISNSLRGRYYFYLARTIKDMGKHAEAIPYFKKRVLFPCPPQEKFYSYMEIGDCYKELGKMDKAVFYYSKAWQTRPIRSESLYKLAHYYTFSGQHQLAVLWGEKGRKIPSPLYETLFVDHRVYKYLISYVLSISYYYVGEKEKGRKEIEYLDSIKNQLPEYVKKSVNGNRKFYFD